MANFLMCSTFFDRRNEVMQFCRTPKSVPDLSFHAWSTRSGALIENSTRIHQKPLWCQLFVLSSNSDITVGKAIWIAFLLWLVDLLSWILEAEITYNWPLVGCNLRQEFGSLEPQNMPTKRLMRLLRQSECGSPGALNHCPGFRHLGIVWPCAKRSTKMRKLVIWEDISPIGQAEHHVGVIFWDPTGNSAKAQL